jgi:DNA ligase (NAD+)
LSFEELVEIEEIGDKIAESIIEYFSEAKHLELIQELKAAGLKFEIVEKEKKGNALEGLSIVISGYSFANISNA